MRVLLLAVSLIIITGCGVQSGKNLMDKTALPLIDSFYSKAQRKEAALAIEGLLSSNPNINLGDSSVLDLKSKFIFLNENSGSFMGYKILKKRYIQDDIAVYSCLGKYDKKFYRFIFIFYNNGVKTRLYKFLFDDYLEAELEGSLKFYTN